MTNPSMTSSEIIAFLVNYNKWRRGDCDDIPQPSPKDIGIYIDAAIVLLNTRAPIVTDAIMRHCIIDYAVLVGELSKNLHIDDPIWQSIRDCGKSYFDLLIESNAAPENNHD